VDRTHRERLLRRLALSIELPDSAAGRPIVLFGAGQAARVFMALNPLELDGAVISDGYPVPDEGEFALPVVHLSQASEVWKNPFFVIASMHAGEIAADLGTRGLIEGQDFMRPQQVAPSHILLYFDDRERLQDTIEWMNESVRYAKLRWFDNLYVSGDDWDVLTDLDGLTAVLDRGGYSSRTSEWCLDLKWSEPIGFVDEDLYFPRRIGEKILDARMWDPRGFWRVSDRHYPAIFAYHVVFQKGVNTRVPFEPAGLPVHHVSGSGERTKFQNELDRLFSNADASIRSLIEFLADQDFFPPLSNARRAVQTQGREDIAELLRARCEDTVIAAFLIREAAPLDATSSLSQFAAEQGWHSLGSLELSAETRARFQENVRGGVWIETPASAAAGGPRALTVFAIERTGGDGACVGFEEPEIRELKIRARGVLEGTSAVNWLHSSDDSFETIEWLAHLREEELEPFLQGLGISSPDELLRHSLLYRRLGHEPHSGSPPTIPTGY